MNISIKGERLKLYLWIGLAFLSLRTLSGLSDEDKILLLILNNSWRTVYVLVLNFILFEYTLKFFKFTWQGIFGGLFFLLIHLLLYSFGLYVWTRIGILLGIYSQLTLYKSIEDNLESQMGFSVGSVFFFGIVRHIYNYQKLKADTQKLRIEKQEAELNYLKSQTNPHFLFNTLNNIYSLTRDKSDLAPESVLRLSKILRFMLYEISSEYIAIEQELKIISDYIELEKLRYDESLRINFNYDVEDMKQALPPLLLIPLVENAFKHGVSETRNQPFVDIHLAIRQRQLVFFVKNSAESQAEEKKRDEKIGLSNLRRQLELLYKDYSLSVQQGEFMFTATLSINLGSHV
jgi:sensor histidine kinase YesM